jgi:hypothetical protein
MVLRSMTVMDDGDSVRGCLMRVAEMTVSISAIKSSSLSWGISGEFLMSDAAACCDEVNSADVINSILVDVDERVLFTVNSSYRERLKLLLHSRWFLQMLLFLLASVIAGVIDAPVMDRRVLIHHWRVYVPGMRVPPPYDCSHPVP